MTAPVTQAPGANASIRFVDQPITLQVQNAVVTATAGTVYTFEVATDAAFATKVMTKDGVAEGTGGVTSVRLDTLPGGKDYFWHARATGGGTVGPFSAASKFTVGAQIVINAPTLATPANAATTTTRPTLTVTNATRSGPVGAIAYLFEISTTSAFTNTVQRATVAEGSGTTSFTPTSDLTSGATFFWRVTATDASNATSSAPSAVQSFTTRQLTQAETVAQQLGQTLWPGAVPPGATGHATMGEAGFFGQGWGIQQLYYAPGNVVFTSPDLEMLRFFDLFDRGFQPDDAVAWMNSNGYATRALWYPPPEKAVLGLQYVYIAARGKNSVNATWDIVLRVE